jgi:hypothetical protein
MEDELTDNLVEEFGTSRSEAERVSRKLVGYVEHTEESELTRKMRNPRYIPAVLRDNASGKDLISRWNQWIGQFSKESSYQIR